MRVKKYFAYSHLPEFLQKASKPFADLAMDFERDAVLFKETAIYTLISEVELMNSNDQEQTDSCLSKLKHLKLLAKEMDENPQNYINFDNVIFASLLEAKDCAVRAALPN